MTNEQFYNIKGMLSELIDQIGRDVLQWHMDKLYHGDWLNEIIKVNIKKLDLGKEPKTYKNVLLGKTLDDLDFTCCMYILSCDSPRFVHKMALDKLEVVDKEIYQFMNIIRGIRNDSAHKKINENNIRVKCLICVDSINKILEIVDKIPLDSEIEHKKNALEEYILNVYNSPSIKNESTKESDILFDKRDRQKFVTSVFGNSENILKWSDEEFHQCEEEIKTCSGDYLFTKYLEYEETEVCIHMFMPFFYLCGAAVKNNVNALYELGCIFTGAQYIKKRYLVYDVRIKRSRENDIRAIKCMKKAMEMGNKKAKQDYISFCVDEANWFAGKKVYSIAEEKLLKLIKKFGNEFIYDSLIDLYKMSNQHIKWLSALEEKNNNYHDAEDALSIAWIYYTGKIIDWDNVALPHYLEDSPFDKYMEFVMNNNPKILDKVTVDYQKATEWCHKAIEWKIDVYSDQGFYVLNTILGPDEFLRAIFLHKHKIEVK